jgi:hypothetical protein
MGYAVVMQTLLTDLGIGESPCWHQGRLWFSNWGMQEVVAVNLAGQSEVVLRVPTSLPFSIDWLPDGPLTGLSKETWNELVVDGRGNVYTNGSCGVIALVSTLIIAEWHGKKPTAFDIAADGTLANRHPRRQRRLVRRRSRRWRGAERVLLLHPKPHRNRHA